MHEGVDCVVVEALGRSGGRAHTESRVFGVPFDVGCAWLHAAAMTNGSSEPFVRLAYAVAAPGAADARRRLAEPVAERLWIAGEALAGGLMQTAGGPQLWGEAVARDVARTLRGRAVGQPGRV